MLNFEVPQDQLLSALSHASVLVFDLDGVLYLGNTAIPHAADSIARLESSGKQIYYLTNNSAKTRDSYCEKLARVNGLKVHRDQIFTSAYATALYLQTTANTGCSVYILGEKGLADEIANVGLIPITVPDSVPPESIDYVVSGIDRKFTYDKLRFGHQAIIYGHAKFIATNRDSTFPTETGEVPGGGSLVAALANSTGQEPITIGKPEVHAYQSLLLAAGAPASASIMIGDRLDTDIAVGNRVGAKTVLTLTGVTDEASAMAASPELRPTFIIGDLREMM